MVAPYFADKEQINDDIFLYIGLCALKSDQGFSIIKNKQVQCFIE